LDKVKKEKTDSAANSKSSTPVPPLGNDTASDNSSGRSSRLTRRKDSEPDPTPSNNNMDECPADEATVSETVTPETEKIIVPEQPVVQTPIDEEIMEVVETPQPQEVALQPLDTLIQAAAQLNPKEFELPYEFMQPVPFPGTDRG